VSATVIADLAAELEIPADGTLSRVLYRDDRLRVVGFAFSAGQELTEHTSALPVVIQVVRGRLELTLGQDHASATPGCWVHLPARLPHAVRAAVPSIMLLTMLADPGQPAPDATPDQ
jgi:quercetin dioxygenase-like cupin family protein